MNYWIYSIEECEKAFGIQTSLPRAKQISMLAKQQLIFQLEQEGLSFDMTIAVGEKGKPFFLYNQGLHFSISHTKDHIALAIDTRPVGIDIEQQRPYKPALVSRFFHTDEYAFIDSLLPEQQAEAFTRLWTLKEAAVKCTGTGISGEFDQFAILPAKVGQQPDYTKLTVQGKDPYPTLNLRSLYIEKHNLNLALCTL